MLGAALIAGCAQAPLHESAAQTQQQPSAARTLGNPQAAARRYQQLAAQSRRQARAKWQLLAAENWWRAGNVNKVKTFVRTINPRQLNRVQRARLSVLKARVDFFDQHADKALDQVHMPLRNLPRRIQTDILAVRGRSLFRLGHLPQAVAVLVKREQALDNPEALVKNHRLIWSGLAQTATLQTHVPAPQSANPEVAGWLALGAAARNAWRKSQRQFAARLQKWRSQHPNHPANGGFIRQILARHRQEVAYPHKIALLLPLTGPYQSAAEAVRDGFLSQSFQFPKRKASPSIAIYDTHADPQTAVSAYRQAINSGAALVVGPLTKKAVAAVAGQIPLATRVLALNYLKKKQRAPKKLFQFGLAPEDEARAIAKRLVQNDLMRGVALVPEDDWGRRMLNAFAKRFRALGGQLLAFQTFTLDAKDFSGPIQRVLGLDASHRREHTLARTLARHLNYTPRRRQDAQFVYLAAHAGVARLIKPQLRYYHAIDLPVYAPSQVNNAGADREPDLNGIKFVDTPFSLDSEDAVPALRKTLAKLWPENFARNSRLYALGLDAYRLVPLIHNVARPLSEPLQGVTGLLTMDPHRRIHRGLDWAEFLHDRPKLLSSPSVVSKPAGITTPRSGAQPPH